MTVCRGWTLALLCSGLLGALSKGLSPPGLGFLVRAVRRQALSGPAPSLS